MTANGAVLIGLGMVCAVGTTAATAAAAVQAGVSGARRTPLESSPDRKVTQVPVPDEALPPLPPELELSQPLSARVERLLRLALPAAEEALSALPEAEPLPVLLATPEPLPDVTPALDGAAQASFLHLFQSRTTVPLDLEASEFFPTGRAGGLAALAAGLELLEKEGRSHVLVGGVDSFLNEEALEHLDSVGRLLSPGRKDGFAPGEGAAFLLLGSSKAASEPAVRVEAVGQSAEAGHLGSDEPYRGDGLANAFGVLLDEAPTSPPIQTVLAGLNGEYLGAREWGVAAFRHRERFAEEIQLEHPADCIGDTGAALGLQMVALAALGLETGAFTGPCLAWASSDQAPRAAALLTIQSQEA